MKGVIIIKVDAKEDGTNVILKETPMVTTVSEDKLTAQQKVINWFDEHKPSIYIINNEQYPQYRVLDINVI